MTMPTDLLLNTISLTFASISYVRGKLVNFRAAVPMIIAAVLLSPLGAYSSRIVPFLNWLGFAPKVTAAITAFVVLFASLASFLGHMSIGHIDRLLLTVTGVAAIAGALAGSWIMKYKVTGSQLKKIIGVLLLVMAVKIACGLVL